MKALACLKIFRHLQTLYCTGSRSSAGVSHVQQPSADPWAPILAEELHLSCLWYILFIANTAWQCANTPIPIAALLLHAVG